MDGYRISEAAREAGFSASALRFYEQQGIVVPERAENGYRRYDERSIGSLRFIARAKRLGLTLDETAELLALLDDDDCAPVQSRMRSMVKARIDEAQDQVADLVAFTAELQRVASRLGTHTPHGPCDDGCGCTTEPAGRDLQVVDSVPLAGGADGHVACSLDADAVEGRLADWNRVLAQAIEREATLQGTRLRFDRGVDVSAITALAVAEQGCCSFFDFSIGITGDAVTLEIGGPPEARDVITAFSGA